jgi:hypothetical protein
VPGCPVTSTIAGMVIADHKVAGCHLVDSSSSCTSRSF